MDACPEREEIKETIAELFLKLNNHLNSLQSDDARGHRDHVTVLNGHNVGAATIINPTHIAEGDTESGRRHFCINIYVNNNVQGVNNSILLGSKVAMRDPGVRLAFPSPLEFEQKGKKRKRKITTTWPMECRYGVTLLLCMISLLWVLHILFPWE